MYNLSEKLRKLPREKLVKLVQEVFEKYQSFMLSEYNVDTKNKPDLVLEELPSAEFKIICEIKSTEIDSSTIFTLERDISERIARGFTAERYFVVYPFKLQPAQKLRIQQDYGLFYKRDLRIYDIDLFISALKEMPELEELYFPEIKSWHEAYSTLTDLLLSFYNKNQEETGRLLFERMLTSKIRAYADSFFFQAPDTEPSRVINPIQIFASINHHRIENKQRIEIINTYLQILNSKKTVSEDTKFYGIPAAPIYQLLRFKNPPLTRQIWSVFSSVTAEPLDTVTPKLFELLKEWQGIDVPSFTLFLFWTRSSYYVPLDNKTAKYLRDLQLLNKRIPTAQSYTNLCKQILKTTSQNAELFDLPEIRTIVEEAKDYSDSKSESISLSGSTQSITTKITRDKSTKFHRKEILEKQKKENSKGLKIIAIKPLQSEDPQFLRHLKNLKPESIYKFYDAFTFIDNTDTNIHYSKDTDFEIFNYGELKVSISAVVGRNGSGKSTLADLLFLIINKIANAKKLKSKPRFQSQKVFVELYFITDNLYRMSIGEDIKLYRYSFDDAKSLYYLSADKVSNEVPFKSFDLSNFFYSIALNYSLYGLNSKITGDWITPLFHKNDSYQTPLVLNPKRTEGRIDINIEYQLAKSRLLFNLLDPKLFLDNKSKVIDLVDGMKPVKLEIKLRESAADIAKPDPIKLKKLLKALNIRYTAKIEFKELAEKYIYLKVAKIAKLYPQFKKYKKFESQVINNESLLSEFCGLLRSEQSHVAFKLHQAINYLEHEIYNSTNPNSIKVIIEEIKNTQSTSRENIRTIDLLPPSFLETNVIFQNKSDFNGLSSGQKQFIFAINTIAYHLYNIKSVALYANAYKYSAVNIIFDEIELYFHPDLQRKFIEALLNRIKTLSLTENAEINSLNFIFITHSPFILSDIPKANVLMLENEAEFVEAVPDFKKSETFASNIHDLLANEFYLKKGFMGTFAQSIINDLIEYLTKGVNKNKFWNEHNSRAFINCIGEPFLREDILELHSQKFLQTKNSIDAEIQRLKEIKKRM